MTDIEFKAGRIEEMLPILPEECDNSSITHQSIDLLHTFMMSGADSEKLIAFKSLETESLLDLNTGSNMCTSSLLSDLSKSIGITMGWVINREMAKKDIGVMKKVPAVKMEIESEYEVDDNQFDGYNAAANGAIVKKEEDYDDPVSLAPMKEELEINKIVKIGSKCNTCGMKFLAKSMNDHKRTHLNDSNPVEAQLKRRYECDICGKRFAASTNFSQHRRIHGEDEDVRQPHKCEHCEKRFTRTVTLRRHKRTHHGSAEDKKPFKCDVCNKSFTQLWTLTQHKLRHSEDEDVKLAHSCDFCNKRFGLRSALVHHHKSHHPEIRLPAKKIISP